jgi:hypothetical protein
MIRKRLLLMTTFAMLGLSSVSRAQTQEPSLHSSIAVIRANMGADRVTIISAAMNFSDKDAAAFWPIYRNYEHERSMLDDRREAVIKEYANKYSMLPDADAKAMSRQMFDCDSHLAELKRAYYKKFNKVLSAYTVTKFFQLEHCIDLLMDTKVESSLPLLPGVRQSETGK